MSASNPIRYQVTLSCGHTYIDCEPPRVNTSHYCTDGAHWSRVKSVEPFQIGPADDTPRPAPRKKD